MNCDIDNADHVRSINVPLWHHIPTEIPNKHNITYKPLLKQTYPSC